VGGEMGSGCARRRVTSMQRPSGNVREGDRAGGCGALLRGGRSSLKLLVGQRAR